jgi:hypothetical protein
MKKDNIIFGDKIKNSDEVKRSIRKQIIQVNRALHKAVDMGLWVETHLVTALMYKRMRLKRDLRNKLNRKFNA